MIMVVGGVFAILDLPLPTIEVGITLSVIAVDAANGVVWHHPSWVALTLTAFCAICHGYAHGAELPRGANATDFAMGFVIATGLIHVRGNGVGLVLENA